MKTVIHERSGAMNETMHADSFQEGKRTGLAIGALAAAAVAFVSLLGIEKAVLAIVLGVLAVRGASPASRSRRLALLALGIAVVYALTFAVVMILFHQKIGELFRLLQQMG
jgi:uncharacterized membrane protein